MVHVNSNHGMLFVACQNKNIDFLVWRGGTQSGHSSIKLKFIFFQAYFHTVNPQSTAIYYRVLLIAVILDKGHHVSL